MCIRDRWWPTYNSYGCSYFCYPSETLLPILDEEMNDSTDLCLQIWINYTSYKLYFIKNYGKKYNIHLNSTKEHKQRTETVQDQVFYILISWSSLFLFS